MRTSVQGCSSEALGPLGGEGRGEPTPPPPRRSRTGARGNLQQVLEDGAVCTSFSVSIIRVYAFVISPLRLLCV